MIPPLGDVGLGLRIWPGPFWAFVQRFHQLTQQFKHHVWDRANRAAATSVPVFNHMERTPPSLRQNPARRDSRRPSGPWDHRANRFSPLSAETEEPLCETTRWGATITRSPPNFLRGAAQNCDCRVLMHTTSNHFSGSKVLALAKDASPQAYTSWRGVVERQIVGHGSPRSPEEKWTELLITSPDCQKLQNDATVGALQDFPKRPLVPREPLPRGVVDHQQTASLRSTKNGS